jgi:ATP-dependent Clp protease ATP-binding subunit ClpC
MQIVELMLNEVQKRLAEHHIELELTASAKEALVKEGFDPVFGARPLRRTVTREVENPLSKRILSGEFKEGDTVLVDRPEAEEAYTFARQERVAAAAAS